VTASGLARGDLPPEIVTPPPGPRARELCAELARTEAPGINTLAFGEAILWEEALGANVLDVDRNRYVDLTSGFGAAAVGHRHPRVVEAVRRQAGILLHGLGDVQAHPLRVALARRLCDLVPVDEPRVYFAISGSDAVEIALKTALLATGRSGILAFEPAYHGLTLGALAATSRPAFRQPFVERLRPGVERLPFGWPIADIEDLLAGGRIGCAIVEPVVGREGVLLPPAGWLAGLAAACRASGVLLVADEVFSGFGRTGRWFAIDSEEVRPDLLCCGKALGGGLPIAAAIGRRALMESWAHEGEARHTATFVAHPVACAAALATLDVLESEALAERAAVLGEQLGRRLAGWPDRCAAVSAVRGRGLLWGVEMESRHDAARLVDAALALGVLLLSGGPEGRVVQIAPPLSIAEPQLDLAISLLDRALQ
jgi:4-aminobutyrate aminotransferase / (S)-3-amino-2-methylpropionate transaminase / 5-aminovalerate transaminase